MQNYVEVLPYRFTFIPTEPVSFPEGGAANVLRGALGSILRSIVCVPPCKDPRHCERRDTCPYAYIFEPRALAPGPSGFADLPRPFIIRANPLGGRTLAPGVPFSVDLHLFEVRRPLLSYFVESFGRLAETGVGPGRGRAVLARIEPLSLDGSPLHLAASAATPLALDLKPGRVAVPGVRVRFITPTEIKTESGLTAPPAFAALFSRVRDRLSSLSALYGRGPLEIDHKGLGERAAGVRMVDARIEYSSVKRRSSKTGQVHPLGGFTGEIEYRGLLGEFVPYLRAAKWTGVGRQTVWGNGMIEVHLMEGGGE